MSDDQNTTVPSSTPSDTPKPQRPRRAPAKKPAAPKAKAVAETAAAETSSPVAAPLGETPAEAAKPKRAPRKSPAKAASKPAAAGRGNAPVALDLVDLGGMGDIQETTKSASAPTDISGATTAKKTRRSAPKSTTTPAKAAPKAQTASRNDAEPEDTQAAKSTPKSQSTAAGAGKPRASRKPAKAAAVSDSQSVGTTDHAVQGEPVAKAESVRESAAPVLAATDTASEQDADTQEDGEAPRKSRRGRRGGRGRGRGKSRVAAQQDAETAAPLVESDTSAEDDEELEDLEQAEPESTQDTPSDREKARTGKTGRDAAKLEPEAKPGRRKMFISVVPGEQVEVALVEEGAILEYYLEMTHQAKIKGNIYKGVVHNVDTNLQAAFVNYGVGKNGFLQIDEIHPEYYMAPHEPAKGKKFPPIQKVIKAGQEVLVQVVKEPTGNKGAFLTTWLSLAGRFLVLTPGQEQIGVSRKVDNDEERARLREMMNGIEPGEGLGAIVRTVSAGTSKTTLKNDLQYLKRVWKEIRRKGTSDPAPCLIYQESSLAERAVRDYLTEDVCEVWVDHETVAESLRETVSLLFPRKKDLVRVHVDLRQTLWERFNIQRQLEQIYSREVHLPSGGRLVFDQTEALMAIDINSGKISGKANFESMALRTNLEAAEAIARHLRLRDIGGQVVIDFIEMRDKNHVRDVEKVLRTAMKNDRARHDVARMSSFGLMEIVRQRTGSSALAVTMEPCPCCAGTGIRRNMEWQSLQALRQIGRQARTPGSGNKCVFDATPELGMYLLNHKRDRLREMEQQLNVTIEIRIQP